MAEADPIEAPGTSWLGPERDETDVRSYLAALRNRAWLIVAATVIATLAAAAYVALSPKVYDAESSLLVTPLPTSSTLPTNVPGLIVQSSDPTRDVQTAASVVSSINVARGVKAELGLSESANSILNKVSVQPVAGSNVLAITAKESSPAAAASLANAFAETTIAERTAQFRSSVSQQIAGLKAQIATTTGAAATTALQQQVAGLEALRAGPLPDMSLSATATPPTSKSSPRTTLSLAAGIIVGLVLGILGALAVEGFDSTLRREQQLRARFRLPILARIPRDPRYDKRRRGGRQQAPLAPDVLSLTALEAFRTLRAMVLASRSPGSDPPRSFLLTSASANEGKTTSALNLAASLASSGSSVILIEGDLRRPSLGDALGVTSRYDVTSVVTGEVELESALVSSPKYPNLSVLLARGTRTGAMISGDALFLPTVPHMLNDAERLADFVVVDSPPLLAVIDALELARDVDCVLLVVRLGQTHLGRLEALGSLLAEAYITPAGIVLMGAELPGGVGAYGYGYASTARRRVAVGSHSDLPHPAAPAHNANSVRATARTDATRREST